MQFLFSKTDFKKAINNLEILPYDAKYLYKIAIQKYPTYFNERLENENDFSCLFEFNNGERVKLTVNKLNNNVEMEKYELEANHTR